MTVVLVTDAEQRASLAVVRSLGRAGYTVHVTHQRGRALAAASRFVHGAHVVPDPMRDPVGNAAAHARLCAELGVALCIPVGEATALAVLAAPPQGVVVPLPALDVFRRICDKAVVHDIAREVGLRVPRQLVLESADALREVGPSDVAYPLAIKPSRSIAGHGEAIVKEPVRYAEDRTALEAVVQAAPAAAFPLLLQERVSGDGIGVFHLLWNGEEIARFAHRRLREKPPSGGVSTLRESIVAPADLHERSLALLRRLGLTHGVAMVEFKGEPGADPAIMEINARFWGSLQLAIDAGVDFPAMLAACALGQRVPPLRSWRAGVRSRWFWGDLDHLLIRVRRGVDVRGRPRSRAAWSAIREVLLTRDAGEREEIWRADDRAPFYREMFNWFARR